MARIGISRRRLGTPSELTRILLYLTLLITVGCMAERPDAQSGGNLSKRIHQFNSDSDFNITSKLGFAAPKCSRLCYPFPAEVFAGGKVPCAEHEADVDKWVPCLCTHRPFLRFLVDCIYHKCGPAIPSAFEFGYQICADYNITFPPPREAVEDLNVTKLNDAIDVPETIPKMPLPFSDELPPAEDGGSTSDENPPLNLNLSMESTGVRDKGIFIVGGREGREFQMMVVWVTVIICISGGFVGLL